VIRLVIAIAWLAASTLSRAQSDPPYLAEMPTVERVRADVQGTDKHDTLARQKAAFEQLFRIVGVAAGPRQYTAPGLTPGEQRWRDAYRGAADAARKEAYAGLSNSPPQGWNPFAKSPLQQWNALTGKYERDRKGRDELLRRYFSSDAYAALSTALSEDDRSREGESEFSRQYGTQAAGSVVLLARVVFWLVLAAMVLAVVREWLPFGVSRLDPLKLRAGFRSYRLQWATGRVTDYYRRGDREGLTSPSVLRDITGKETRLDGPVAREHVREMFSLIGADGQRHVVHLVDASVAIPEGHVATVVWAARKGASSGTYVLLFDRTASRTHVPKRDFIDMFRVGRAMYLPALVLAFIVGTGLTIAPGGASENLGGFMGLFLGAIGARVAFLMILTRRASRFTRKDAPRVLAAIDAREPAPS
jgi:hypothetical protein